MTENDSKQTSSNPQLCPKCKKMFGHVSFQLMCSLCYKKQKNIDMHHIEKANYQPQPESKPNKPEQESIDIENQQHAEKSQAQPLLPFKRQLQKSETQVQQQREKGKCQICKKKIGILGYQCKHCIFDYCKLHRLPEDHSCKVDFIALGRKMLKTANPIVEKKNRLSIQEFPLEKQIFKAYHKIRLIINKSLQAMIPAKIFLEKILTTSEVSSKVRINLIMNSIFYDQIRQFQTKYMCVTSLDRISIEIQELEDSNIIGQADIEDLYKLILERKTFEVKILPAKDISWMKQTILTFSLEPVASFNRKKASELTNKQIHEVFNETHTNQFKNQNLHDVSFSHRNPLKQANSRHDFIKQSTGSLQKSQRVNIQLTNANFQEVQSLESLAQQREKILRELFGKFKRDR